MKIDEGTKNSVAEAREIMETFDSSGAMTIGFDDETYTLTASQMSIIAGALYLADCLIYEIEEANNSNNN
jgi:hypothetical protein